MPMREKTQYPIPFLTFGDQALRLLRARHFPMRPTCHACERVREGRGYRFREGRGPVGCCGWGAETDSERKGDADMRASASPLTCTACTSATHLRYLHRLGPSG